MKTRTRYSNCIMEFPTIPETLEEAIEWILENRERIEVLEN